MSRSRSIRALGHLGRVALTLAFACGDRPPPRSASPPTSSVRVDAGVEPIALADAANGVTVADAATPVARLAVLEELARIEGITTISRLDDTLIMVWRSGTRFRMARHDGRGWIDEAKLSRGLPAVRPRPSDPGDRCNTIGRVFGQFPNHAWLVENKGGSMECGASWGDYAIYHWTRDAWVLDRVRGPKESGGVFETWDLGNGVLGFGVSNLVGDSLQGPTDVMISSSGDPWKGRIHLPTERTSFACAAPDGSIYVDGDSSVQQVTPKATRRLGASSGGPCAATSTTLYALHRSALVTTNLATGAASPTRATFPDAYRLVATTTHLYIIDPRVTHIAPIQPDGSVGPFELVQLTAPDAEAVFEFLDRDHFIFRIMKDGSPSVIVRTKL